MGWSRSDDVFMDHKIRMYRFQRRSAEKNKTMSFNIDDDPPSISPEPLSNGTAQTFTFKANRNSRFDNHSRHNSTNASYTKANRAAIQQYRFRSTSDCADQTDVYHQRHSRTTTQDSIDNNTNSNGSQRKSRSVFSRLMRMQNMKKPNMHTALMSRRKVIRLLMAVIIFFALCVLPYHIRLLWQTFGNPPVTRVTLLLSPITFLVYYLNNAMNPFLYAFLSDHFRRSVKDVMACQQQSANKKQQWSIQSNTSIRTPNNAY